ncbi:MAG: TonB-dependent receptor domain-containing protein [Gammaproteobacteria bacterium]
MLRVTSATIGLLMLIAVALPCTAVDLYQQIDFNIPAQKLDRALIEFSRQAKIQVITSGAQLENLQSEGATGKLTISDALLSLLRNSGLAFKAVGESAVSIGRFSSATRASSIPHSNSASPSGTGDSGYTHLAQADARRAERDESAATQGPQKADPVRVNLPEVLIIGSKVLNTDIRRSRDDVQPYVVFDRTVIEQSGATNVHEFLRQRLPMDTAGVMSQQGGSDNRSQFNLRGLGANQTLILIDGRRVANTLSTANTPRQADLNGIPLTAVERIEVLPTTASAIYGGSATGGVINVVLRRDYSGVEGKLTYDSSFRSDSTVRRIDFGGGFNLEGGKTNIMLTGSYAEADPLTIRDRDDLTRRGRETILANNPAALLMSGISPPLGATTNIRSTDGSPLFGPGTPSATSVPAGYGGGGGLAPLQANAGQFNLDLADSGQLFGGGELGLFAASTVASLIASVRREFSPSVQAFLDLGASDNEGEHRGSGVTSSSYMIPATAPNNPFGRSIRVTVPIGSGDGLATTESRDYRIVGGVILRLPREWSVGAEYTWNRSRLEFTNTSRGLSGAVSGQVASGAIDVLRDTNAFPIDFSSLLAPPSQLSPFVATSKDAVLRLAGPVGSVPAGPLTLTGLIEYREDLFDPAVQALPAFNLTLIFPDRSQSVNSAYLELKVPFASAKTNVLGIYELELQLAARYDEYTVKGATGVILSPTDPVERVINKRSSTNPTVGLRYKPVSDLMVRASYSTGFLPPSVSQLTQGTPFTATVIDPRRGGEARTVSVLSGGNPDLRPEESESWSAGVVITPRFLAGLRLSVDWTRIEKTDNILTPFGAPQAAVNNESVVPELVTRQPASPSDPFGVGPITTVNTGLLNIARAEAEAYDVSVDCRVETDRLGAFEFSTIGTWQPHFRTQVVPTAPVDEKVGLSSSNPLKIRGNARLTWERGPWLASWTARYFDDYRLDNSLAIFGPAFDHVRSQGSDRIPSQTYHDFFASYRFSESTGDRFRLMADSEVQLGVKNVFDKEPPLDVSNTVSFYSFFGDPRGASYYVSFRKSF